MERDGVTLAIISATYLEVTIVRSSTAKVWLVGLVTAEHRVWWRGVNIQWLGGSTTFKDLGRKVPHSHPARLAPHSRRTNRLVLLHKINQG